MYDEFIQKNSNITVHGPYSDIVKQIHT